MPSTPSKPSTSNCTYYGITLSWAASLNADEYNLLLSQEPNFSLFEQGYNEDFLTASISEVIENLDPGKKIFL
jgi:hypothetical protein